MTFGRLIKGCLITLALFVLAIVLFFVALDARWQWLKWSLRQPVELQVVDEAGRPAAGTEVTAVYYLAVDASGPFCTEDLLGHERAGPDGQVRFRGLDVDQHGAHGDWQVWLSVKAPGDSPAVLRWRGGRVVAGGTRDVDGRMELPRDCQKEGLEVIASPLQPFNGWCQLRPPMESTPEVRAPIAPDGRFRLTGLRHQGYFVTAEACGLTMKRVLEPQAREIELEAPSVPTSGVAKLPRSTAPAPASACLPFDRPAGQIAEAAGDQVQVSPGCAAVAVVGKHGSDGWSLVEPSGAVTSLGQCSLFELGEDGAVACRAPDQGSQSGSLWVARKGASPLLLGSGPGTWSPRGRWLVFWRGRHLAAYDRTTGSVSDLSARGLFAFVDEENLLALDEQDLVRIDLGHGGEAIPVRRGVSRLQALPGTGRALVMDSSGDLVLLDAEGTSRFVLHDRDTSVRAVAGGLAILQSGAVSRPPSVITALDVASGDYRTLVRGAGWVRARGGMAAVIENHTGRVIAIPLESGPGRFLGVEPPGTVSGELSVDGRWLQLFGHGQSSLFRTDGGARREIASETGAWAPDANVYYWRSGSDLHASFLDEDRSIVAATNVTAFAPLAGGRFLTVRSVAPGDARTALELQHLP